MAVKKLAKKKPAAAKAVKKAMPKAAAKKMKAPAKASAPVAKKNTAAVSKPFTKTEIMGEIAGATGLAQKQVSGVFDALHHVIERHVKKNAAGTFVMPGLLKIQVVHKPATKARKGVNPFTGEMTTFKAKPARNVIKVKALKKLKEMV